MVFCFRLWLYDKVWFYVQFDFSLVFPGETAKSMGSSQRNAVCDKISTVNPPPNTKEVCTIGSVATYNGTNAILNGYFYYEWTRDPTAGELQVAQAVRDQIVENLRTRTSSIFSSTFKGVYSNCDCKELQTVNASAITPFDYNTNLTGIPGPVQCGARLIYDTGVANANINIVGIDDGSGNSGNLGKYCSNPAVDGGVLGNPGSGSCRQYGVIASASGTSQATAVSSKPATGIVSTSMITITQQGSGYSTVPKVTISAPNPAPATVSVSLAGASPTSITLSTLENGPYAARPSGSIGGGLCIDAGSGAGTCTGALTTIQDYQGNQRYGRECSTSDFNSNNGCGGSNCVTWSTGSSNQAVTKVQFPGADPSKVYCTFPPTISLSDTFLQKPIQAQGIAQITGDRVTNIVMNSPGSGYRTAPTITIEAPTSNDLGKLCSPNPVTLPTNIAVNTPISGGITPTGQCQPLGRDTRLGKVCSVPAAPNGGLWRTLNQGTCNVDSSFRNQPSPTDTYKCGIVRQEFVTQVARSPSPPPPPVQKSPPPPSPVSSPPPPSPRPSPPPPAPLVCTYKGTYQISPLYGPCDKYYMASGTDSNCRYNLVTLRTRRNVYPKYDRIKWNIDTTAEGGISKPINIGSVARPRCANKNLAASRDPTTLKVGGTSWKWQIVPWPKSNRCDEVNLISQNRLRTDAFLEVPRTCDRFLYNATDGGRQRFKLRKLS